MYVLTHQVVALEMSEEDSSSEGGSAGELLFDWMVYLLSVYHRSVLGTDEVHHHVMCHHQRTRQLSCLTQSVFGVLCWLDRRRKKGKDVVVEESRESASHLLRLTPEELSRVMYPRVHFLDERLRAVSVDDDGGEPWLPLAWPSLTEIMGRLDAKHVMVVDAGRSLHLMRSGGVVTLEDLRGGSGGGGGVGGGSGGGGGVGGGGREPKMETIVDVHVRRRRCTSTRDPLLYREGSSSVMGKEMYTKRIKSEMCLDDGGGEVRGTYRHFCERLKMETSQYLKTTSQ